jgi:ParB family chromosome partitioning protein
MTTTTVVTEKPIAPDKRRALGRGLDSLLPSRPQVVAASGAAVAAAPAPTVLPELQAQAVSAAGPAVVQIPLEQIDKNSYQTRTSMPQEELQEMAESIRTSGVIQPIVVRPGEGGRYMLITGQRRWEASRLAGKAAVPAIVRRVSDQQAAEMTVVENLQREDLNCMDQARAFAMLSQGFGMTQEEIGKQVGVSRESVANYMRLLKLPEDVQELLRAGRLEFSHARVLLKLVDLPQASHVAKLALEKDLTVHKLEEMVERINVPFPAMAPASPEQPRIDPNVRAAQEELERQLGVRVRIQDRKGKGKIVIEYGSLEDFDRVVEMLSGRK